MYLNGLFQTFKGELVHQNCTEALRLLNIAANHGTAAAQCHPCLDLYVTRLTAFVFKTSTNPHEKVGGASALRNMKATLFRRDRSQAKLLFLRWKCP